MTAVPALWTKHRGIAIGIASQWFIPGASADDVRQEALIALWVACGDYKPEQGVPFPSFARMVIQRRLASCLKVATRPGKRLLTESSREDWQLVSCDEQDARMALWDLVEATRTLTLLERTAVQRFVDGTYDSYDKRMDNALTRARRKLRAAAA